MVVRRKIECITHMHLNGLKNQLTRMSSVVESNLDVLPTHPHVPSSESSHWRRKEETSIRTERKHDFFATYTFYRTMMSHRHSALVSRWGTSSGISGIRDAINRIQLKFVLYHSWIMNRPSASPLRQR